MGKVTDIGSVPEDSDLFSGGLTWSFHRSSRQSTDDGSSDSSNPVPEVRKQTQDEDTPQEDEPLSEEEMKAYMAMQDKIDQYLHEVHGVSHQAMESLKKARSVMSDDTTPDNRESR
jgi:hypothetical protein